MFTTKLYNQSNNEHKVPFPEVIAGKCIFFPQIIPFFWMLQAGEGKLILRRGNLPLQN
jgi:hypothetical protein